MYQSSTLGRTITVDGIRTRCWLSVLACRSIVGNGTSHVTCCDVSSCTCGGCSSNEIFCGRSTNSSTNSVSGSSMVKAHSGANESIAMTRISCQSHKSGRRKKHE